MNSLARQLCLVFLLLSGSPAFGEEPAIVRIGVQVKRSSKHCLAKWTPTADFLSERIAGYSFTIAPIAFGDLVSTVRRGDVDFVLANASVYVELEMLAGSTRIATLKNRRDGQTSTANAGVIFCRADRDDIQTVDDLRGHSFISVHETALCAWLAVWRALKERGIDPHRDFAELSFGGTVDAVVQAVSDGDADVGGLRTDTLERLADEGKIALDDFRVLKAYDDDERWDALRSTRAYPEWPFAKARETSPELAERVAAALIAMPADSAAATTARCAGWTVPLNYQPVHDCLKALRVGPYQDYGRVTLRDAIRQHWPWLVVAVAALIVAIVFAGYVGQLNRRLRSAVDSQTREIARRKRLEREVVEIADAEQRRIGQDLHDGLLQHLTGVAAMSEHMRNTMPASERSPGVATKITELLREAIVQARGLARGLYPVEIERDGLAAALEELADNTRRLFDLECRFERSGEFVTDDIEVATHLYRIAQEAVNNAARHGDAREVMIRLDVVSNGVQLLVEDDGKGAPDWLIAAAARRPDEVETSPSGGMGFWTMRRRSRMIDAELSIRRGRERGTRVICTLKA